jgi:mRNA interferase MazF
MVMEKGEIYWVDFSIGGESEPGYRRPALVVQSDRFNRSAIGSVMVAPLSTNLSLAKAPGNVLVEAKDSGLPKDSVIVVSQIVSINKRRLDEYVSALDPSTLFLIDNCIRLLFDL